MLICLDTMCFALCQLEKYSGKEMHSPWEQTQIKSNISTIIPNLNEANLKGKKNTEGTKEN